MSTLSFATRLHNAIRRTQSITCVGLDPRLESIPESLRNALVDHQPSSIAAVYTRFCCEIIDAVRDLVPCVKPQAAFFEQLGPAGMVSMGEVIRYANDAGLLVILDGKRNDIGSTAAAYADAYLGGPWGSDALTVSPYLGRDSIEPFVETCQTRGAGIFVLVKTSNPGGGDFQDRVADGQTLYRSVAEMLTTMNKTCLDADQYGPVGAVVGATYPQQLVELRTAMPHSVLLVPGYGAQGGTAADVRAARDQNGLGVVVNSSRHIIFAHLRPEFRESLGNARWQDAVRNATVQMNQELHV